MRHATRNILIAGGVLLTITVLFMSFKTKLLKVLSSFVPSVEGFSATPYWDVSRYSWGYGTAAPGQTGTITREKAFKDMEAYLLHDYDTLSSRITRKLNVNQWAALLDFSYNLGIGNALNIVPYINDGDDNQLWEHWQQYVHADGVVNQNLVQRRAKEWGLWNS